MYVKPVTFDKREYSSISKVIPRGSNAPHINQVEHSIKDPIRKHERS